MTWTVVAAGAAAGVVFGYQWLQRARASAARGLEEAERVTEATRQTLGQAEQAIRTTRNAIS